MPITEKVDKRVEDLR